jgi:hypothetical protein
MGFPHIDYVKGQELAPMSFVWRDGVGALIDFSTGYTLTAKLALQSSKTATLLTKTVGVTGSASSPNIVINWATADFTSLTAAGTVYVVWLYATRVSDGLHRVFSPGALPTFTLLTAPT